MTCTLLPGRPPEGLTERVGVAAAAPCTVPTRRATSNAHSNVSVPTRRVLRWDCPSWWGERCGVCVSVREASESCILLVVLMGAVLMLESSAERRRVKERTVHRSA